ncbi:transcription factor bHLH121 isoform X1 [Olea europaea var. sylvestris]|uniref:transcription factor bHLH121 isoform X1 n=1 Tax=Olea europaea var. sylvestris TaxID=158386 RepID=UPI000C1D5211|nr:transcription factor bHLH121 isoform X1 [Olea europaea var. sylvestris]XP_022869055.1 transcription factor bHLH121 isoform X1 [Olea europaea var. sylvestris]
MDQLDSDPLFQPIQAPNNFQPQPDLHIPSSRSQPDCRFETEVKDSIAARKVQKADREKLRRDRLNEQFADLGNALDPDRPKNDKVSILTDTIQMLKDLTAQVNKLKAEYSTLTEESREQLTQEKNDIREEKASLKSDIESLNAQYQQRLRSMYPWLGLDRSVVMHPPSYPFPMPMPIPTGTIPMHPSMQPYPYYGNQNPATFVPYMAHNTMMEQQSTHVSQVMQPGNRSHTSSKQESRNKSSDGESSIEKSDDSNDIATDLELKTPGSTSEMDSTSKPRKSRKLPRKENSLADGGSSSGCLSTHSVQATSSNSIAGGAKTDD